MLQRNRFQVNTIKYKKMSSFTVAHFRFNY